MDHNNRTLRALPGKYYKNIVNFICTGSQNKPLLWLLIILLATIPALIGIGNLGLDSNLIRLLPSESSAVKSALDLKDKVGDGGYFTIILECSDREQLIKAVRSTAERIKKLKEVHITDYMHPAEFYSYYRYFLIPGYHLEKIDEFILSLKAKYSPFTDDLLDDEEVDENKKKNKIDLLINQLNMITGYHESEDGRMMGIFIKPYKGIADLKETRKLFSELKRITLDISREYSIPVEIGASQQSLEEYDIIISDLKMAGIVSLVLILGVLLVSFRSVKIIPVILFPLVTGLIWAFSLVPVFVGKLNIITSFLLLVLFGMGVDYSIHLVKRFQKEIGKKPFGEAILETFYSTGKSVVLSGLTTAIPLFILLFSEFRGFLEFGLITGSSIIIIIISMAFIMPVSLVLGYRLKLIPPDLSERKIKLPSHRFILTISLLILIVSVFAISHLFTFDYDFNKFTIQNEEYNKFKEREKKIYPVSMSPAAIYVAENIRSLDLFLDTIKERLTDENSKLEKVISIRNFAPGEQESAIRLKLLKKIRERLKGEWVNSIKKKKEKRIVLDILNWPLPEDIPGPADVPENLKLKLTANDGSGNYLAGIYPNISRRNGKEAMAATKELYGLNLPSKVKGPIGEMPVFAEILWLVSSEVTWIIGFAFLSVFLIIFAGSGSIKESIWIILPLFTGMIIAMGIMSVSGVKLNFFNIVVIPSLFGMGVDHGIHFFNRWKEKEGNSEETLSELSGPISICTITTMMGYSGMIFARHYGLRSIGLTAAIGMISIWFTSIFLFPAILRISRKTDK